MPSPSIHCGLVFVGGTDVGIKQQFFDEKLEDLFDNMRIHLSQPANRETLNALLAVPRDVILEINVRELNALP